MTPPEPRGGEGLPNKHVVDHPDAYLNALLDYTKGFYFAVREAGLPAKVCVDAMQHVESAARGLHRKAMDARPTAPSASGGGAVALDNWHEDYGPKLWWSFPIQEPPYVGTPNDTYWPGYHTHYTDIPLPAERALFHTGETKGDGRG